MFKTLKELFKKKETEVTPVNIWVLEKEEHKMVKEHYYNDVTIQEYIDENGIYFTRFIIPTNIKKSRIKLEDAMNKHKNLFN